MHHYWCYTVYVPKTRCECVTDAITFLPSTIPIPTYDADAHLQQAAEDILQLLKTPTKNLPTFSIEDTVKNAIRLVAEILNRTSTHQSSNYNYLDPTLLEKNSTYYQLKS